MAEIIKPKVTIIDYGPKLKLSDSQTITPDEFVWGASRITYKDVGVINELLEAKRSEKDLREEMTRSLVKSIGAGHASMATTPGLWILLEGTCSKIVDSIFTGARFSSSLMPSARRVPIDKSQIVIPKQIRENKDASDMYLQTSEKNIEAYELLQERGVPKQEASKIVQYGHKGGGFCFMPLETIVQFAREIESNDLMPEEGKEIISQLEDFIFNHGIAITYKTRKASPRSSYLNPDIFHNRKNQAEELIEKNHQEVLSSPAVVYAIDCKSEERDKRIKEYLKNREKVFMASGEIKSKHKILLNELEKIIEDYNNTVSFVTVANTPWRVWGEVKRHRTLPQTAESIYNAVDRAIKTLEEFNKIENKNERFEFSLKNLSSIFSTPDTVKENPENLRLWEERLLESLQVYEKLIKTGIKKSNAVLLIPRGIKFGVVKSYDLYNLSVGYMSLRLCKTAEPEMRQITEQEHSLAKNSLISKQVTNLISPKCYYTGFCLDTKCCGKIKNAVQSYDENFHKEMWEAREKLLQDPDWYAKGKG